MKLKPFTDCRRVGGKKPGSYAIWVRNLKRKSGVYVIRKDALLSSKPGRVVYVGESHSGRLYETLTRHFQDWDGPQEHTVYDRETHTVSVKITGRGQAIQFQNSAIKRLQPRDNKQGLEDVGDTSFNFGKNAF